MPEDVAPELDPLFVGLTHPPLMWGVPMAFFGVNFILLGIGFIALTSLLHKVLVFALVCLPLHGVAYLLTARDAHWMAVLMVKLNTARPTRNAGFWHSNSYAP